MTCKRAEWGKQVSVFRLEIWPLGPVRARSHLSSISAQPTPPYVWDVTVSDPNEEFTVSYASPSREQAAQSPLDALPACEQSPLPHGSKHTSKGTVT